MQQKTKTYKPIRDCDIGLVGGKLRGTAFIRHLDGFQVYYHAPWRSKAREELRISFLGVSSANKSEVVLTGRQMNSIARIVNRINATKKRFSRKQKTTTK